MEDGPMRRRKQAYFGFMVGTLEFLLGGISLDGRSTQRAWPQRTGRAWSRASEFFFGRALLLALPAENDHRNAKNQKYACDDLNGLWSHVPCPLRLLNVNYAPTFCLSTSISSFTAPALLSSMACSSGLS